MRFSVNETAKGIVSPPKDVCKVKGCKNLRMKKNRPHAFCKLHSGLRKQMAKKKFKDLVTNNEIIILEN